MGHKAGARKGKKEGTPGNALHHDGMKVTFVESPNPKREGTKAFKKFAMFRKGMTLGAYRKAVDKKFGAGEANPEINYCVEAGFIKVK